MSMRKLAVAAIGLCMLVLGPAATLTAPEPAQADSMTCTQTCNVILETDQLQCRMRLPPVPSEDDMFEYGSCMVDASLEWFDCWDICP
jgi:hypothetical protein